MKVIIGDQNVGANSGCVGTVNCATTGRRLWTSETRPYGMHDAALQDAHNWATEHGHEIVLKVSDEYRPATKPLTSLGKKPV